MVEVELCKIVIAEHADVQFIVLRQIDGSRQFPIAIGLPEAMAIDRGVKEVEMPRPMTHDLIGHVIEALGGRLERVVISDLHDNTFFATLHIERDGEIVEVDSRSSDAVALAVLLQAPIYAEEHVLQRATSYGSEEV